jgi:hypothetical protein
MVYNVYYYTVYNSGEGYAGWKSWPLDEFSCILSLKAYKWVLTESRGCSVPPHPLFFKYDFFWFVRLVHYLFIYHHHFWFYRDRVSLCSPGCPGTHSVDQASLELRNSPASASQVLGLKACNTTARLDLFILCICIFILSIWIHCFHAHQRGHRVPLQVVVNDQVVAGSWIQEFCKNSCQVWWSAPLIPALGKQKQVDFWVWGQPGLQRQHPAALEYESGNGLRGPREAGGRGGRRGWRILLTREPRDAQSTDDGSPTPHPVQGSRDTTGQQGPLPPRTGNPGGWLASAHESRGVPRAGAWAGTARARTQRWRKAKAATGPDRP